MNSKVTMALVVTAGIALVGCNSSDSNEENFVEAVSFKFSETNGEWTKGFADYPVGREDEWELTAEENRSFNLLDGGTEKGLYLHSYNRSDDTQMYISREITGLMPSTHYDVVMSVTIATNVTTECQGIGGAPHAVSVKAGMTRQALEVEVDNIDHYRVTADFGQQTQGGLDGEVLGDIGNDALFDCDPSSEIFALKTLSNEGQAFEFTTDENGSGWLTVMTDSGFEGPTSLFITLLDATFSVSAKNPSAFEVSFDFSQPQKKTQPLFFDYPLGAEWEWELTATPQTTLPLVDGGEVTGYYLHSYNRSDDTGMLLYTPIKGLTPNAQYSAEATIIIATNVNDMCFGIGGAPHSVAVKTALSVEKPEASVPQDDNHYRINLDIGNNMSDGSQGFTLGHIGLTDLPDCDPGAQRFGLKEFDTKDVGQSLTITTDDSGVAYFSVLTDSGFEGATSMMFTKASLALTRVN